jgi:N-acetylmuramoyl-L-alanine amidase
MRSLPLRRRNARPALRLAGPWLPAAASLLALGLALAGCAGVQRPPAGYDRRVDPLDGIDPSRLAGRRIVIDPGHGGYFRGALGVRGLTEAEVNLGVSLELAKLLRERGAQVLLTRETDRDFLTPADSSLRSDLAERVRIGNAFQPELFVSVHHNADARGSHDVNEVQVYYQLGDEGPATEAAADIHRFLTRNLGIAPSRLIPGNFAVLRGSEAPALLTESSYITYPPTEMKLAREDSRRLEAEAIYLGIAAFFSRRAPVIEQFGADHPPFTTGGLLPSESVRLIGIIRGSFDQVSLRVDGEPVEPAVIREPGASLVTWAPASPLSPGTHEATLVVRLAGEGSSRRARTEFEIRAEPHSIAAEFPNMPDWDGRPLLAARLRVLSRGGVPVRDSLPVRVRVRGPVTPSDTVVTLRDGVAWAYFAPTARAAAAMRAVAEGDTAVALTASLGAWPGASAGTSPGVSRGAADRTPPSVTGRAAVRKGFSHRLPFFVTGMPEGGPLRDALGTLGPEPAIQWINRDGFTVESGRSGENPNLEVPSPMLHGYRLWAGEPGFPPRFIAIAGRALHGRRIVVDAAGGGDDAAGTSASGGRGAALNLEVARMLSSMLEAAGADVRMTRTSDAAVSELERVRISEAFRAERYVRIGHPASPPRLGHYFSSAAGRRWAERLAGLAVELGLPRPRVGDDAQYPIQQTSATALYAGLGRVDSTSAPFGGYDPARLRTEAYAIYLSLAREWVPDAAWPLDWLEVRDDAGRPRAGAVVRLGGALVLQTDPLGRIRFARTEPGPMLVQVEDSSPASSRVLLESDRGVVLTGPGVP